MKYKKKKGTTLIEIVVFITISIILVTISSSVLINTRKIYKSTLSENNTLNEIEDLFINIDNILKINGVFNIEVIGDSIEVTYIDEYSNIKMIKKILMNTNVLIVKTYKYSDDSRTSTSTNSLYSGLESYNVVKRKGLIFISIVKEGREYIKCL